jgi:hypothetical protein
VLLGIGDREQRDPVTRASVESSHKDVAYAIASSPTGGANAWLSWHWQGPRRGPASTMRGTRASKKEKNSGTERRDARAGATCGRPASRQIACHATARKSRSHLFQVTDVSVHKYLRTHRSDGPPLVLKQCECLQAPSPRQFYSISSRGRENSHG